MRPPRARIFPTQVRRVGAKRIPIATARTMKTRAFVRISPMVVKENAPVWTSPVMMARITSPRMSSRTAAPRTTREAASWRRPRSERTRAVIPTLVAVRVAPMKTATSIGFPHQIASAYPSAKGQAIPTRATTEDWSPARSSSPRSDSRPISKRRRMTPISAKAWRISDSWTKPSPPGPMRTPARSSPRAPSGRGAPSPRRPASPPARR